MLRHVSQAILPRRARPHRARPVRHRTDQEARLHRRVQRPKLTTEQADKLEARGNRYLYEINSRWTIDGTSRKNLGRYANHSCRPNAESHSIGHKVILRAIKNIKLGDEITYSYGRDYLVNVITRRGCKCDKCREKRAEARTKARRAKARLNGRTKPGRTKSRR
jgi:SET domain-containing protein